MTTRRDFVKWSAASGAALVLGVTRDHRVVQLSSVESAPDWAPNQWLRIDASGDVTISAAQSEMGQGVRTALPMIVAEELGADWARVHIVHARPSPSFRDMRTSGSGSVQDSWNDLRKAAAAAREMLVAAAASEWKVDASACSVDANAVIHRATGRRLDFGALVARVSLLAVPAGPMMKAATDYRLLGTRVARVDGPSLVDGSAVFGLDARPRGVAVAAIARPPQHGARVGAWNDDAARAIRGVTNVVEVSTGVAVIADRTWAAMRGRDALHVEWKEAPSDHLNSAAYRHALELAIESGKVARREGGDVDRALAGAARTMDATFLTPFQGHSAMEPLNCVADVRGDRCEIWVGTQAPNQAQEHVAKLLGIPLDNVRISITLLGGGFGRRLDVDYVTEAVEVSRAAGCAVQVVWTREDDVRHDRYQPAQVNRLTAALDGSGKITAWRHRVADYNLTMFGAYDPKYDPAADGNPWGGFDTPYRFPALDVTLALLESPVPTGAWRSVTYPASVFARESFLDEVAHATNQDPVALRLALIPSPGNVKRGATTRADGDRLRGVISLAAEKSGWRTPLPVSNDGRRWGRGIACNSYHNGTMAAEVAEVSVGAAGDLRVHHVVCAVDCGQVVNRWGVEGQFESGVVWGLSAALESEITFERGRTVQRNFNDFPVLRMSEMPRVDVHIVPSDLPPCGIGEPPVPPVAPAVMNAVFAATGRRIRQLPVRAADLRA